MKGIVGILYPEAYQVYHHIDVMLDAIRHRNGDHRNFLSHKNLQIGMCGGNFVFNEKKSLYACLDGYFSNTSELIAILKKQGVAGSQLLSHDDILLHGYETFGISFLSLLHGDFAVAIFDQQKEKLILARDPIGKKPMYWYSDQRHVIFGSELKSLLASSLVPQTVAKEAIAAYLHFGYIPQDMSPIKDVNKLLPGHYLQMTLNRNISIHSFWSYSSFFQRKSTIEKRHFENSLEHLINRAVHSGIETGSNIFVPSSQNSGIAERLGIQADAYSPSPNLESLMEALWHLDEPQADPEILTLWQIAAQASQKNTIIFTDLGFKETLNSIVFYQEDHQALAPYYRSHISSRWKFLIPVMKWLYEPLAFKFLKHLRTHSWQIQYAKRHAFMDDKTMQAAFPKLSTLFDPEVFFNKFHHLARLNNLTSSLLYCDMKTRIPDCSILQMERMTAAHGLEWRTPFLDRHLIELLASNPKTNTSYTQNHSPLTLLPSQELINLLDLLPNGGLVENGLLLKSWVSERIKSFKQAPKANEYRLLWGILSLELWYRLYIIQPISSSPPEFTVKDLLRKAHGK